MIQLFKFYNRLLLESDMSLQRSFFFFFFKSIKPATLVWLCFDMLCPSPSWFLDSWSKIAEAEKDISWNFDFVTLINPYPNDFLLSSINFQLFQAMAYHLSVMVETTIWRRKRTSTLFGVCLSKKSWRAVLDWPSRNVTQQQKAVRWRRAENKPGLREKQEIWPNSSS